MNGGKERDAPDPIDVAVGSRIRAHRRALHMTQEELGRAIGVTFQQVQKYEVGKNRISASTLARTAQALGRTVGHLMGEGEILDRETRQMIVAFRRLDESRKQAVLALARSLEPW